MPYRPRPWSRLDEGWGLNRKCVGRLWREEGLRVPKRRRKRQRIGESTVPAKRLHAEHPNQVWALDFKFDQTADGRLLKLLHLVDEHTREALPLSAAGASTPIRRSPSSTGSSPPGVRRPSTFAATTAPS
ncbi:MAG TPA: hypothetical protein VGV57_00830 [Thermoleophilaceae bacterium]|nr:hypothetical protein [Thermoleophilaceae bacterium]